MGSTSSGLKLTLDAAAKKAAYDQNAKAILSHKVLLAWILKSCVREFKRYKIAY